MDLLSLPIYQVVRAVRLDAVGLSLNAEAIAVQIVLSSKELDLTSTRLPVSILSLNTRLRMGSLSIDLITIRVK